MLKALEESNMETTNQWIKQEVEEILKDHNGTIFKFQILLKDYKIYLNISLEGEFCLFVELVLPFSLIPIIYINRLTQQRVEEGDRIKKLSPKERLKLLKETLKKSTTLTEKLLRRLDKKWDNIYKEDSEDGKSFFFLF